MTSLPPLSRSTGLPSRSAATTSQVPWSLSRSFLAASPAVAPAASESPTASSSASFVFMAGLLKRVRGRRGGPRSRGGSLPVVQLVRDPQVAQAGPPAQLGRRGGPVRRQGVLHGRAALGVAVQEQDVGRPAVAEVDRRVGVRRRVEVEVLLQGRRRLRPPVVAGAVGECHRLGGGGFVG